MSVQLHLNTGINVLSLKQKKWDVLKLSLKYGEVNSILSLAIDFQKPENVQFKKQIIIFKSREQM